MSQPDSDIMVRPQMLVLEGYLATWDIKSCEPHGKTTFGSKTTHVIASCPGTEQDDSFFVKEFPSKEPDSRAMALGEFESMKAMYLANPHFVPRPIDFFSWESFVPLPDGQVQTIRRNSLLFEFLPLIPDVQPSPTQMAQNLATLHTQSESPTGKFGFHVPTYPGNIPQYTKWEEKWERFFAKALCQALDQEIRVKGQHPLLDALVPVLFDEVIPRLLRPLESDGRTVKPSLVHGDLWFGNSGVWNAPSSLGEEGPRAAVFDAACVYAHNEYEFGQWRPACNKFGPEYLEAYHKIVPKSEPKEDYDGRLDLYKLKFNTHVSALFPANAGLREQMLGDIKDLVQRFGSEQQ
ncbi:Fructosamine kinase domain containing protein [Naviculisporaceae sp. PSN 640]